MRALFLSAAFLAPLVTLMGCSQLSQSPALVPAKSAARQADTQAQAPQPAILEKLDSQHLPNAFRIHPVVISGGQPEGEAGFAELKELGIKTIISVDGAKPDLPLAEKYGLRYVHLPHGYDGIPEPRVQELAKAVRELPGPIYIHCHHGKHRSPAAAAVACVGAGLIDQRDARPVLVLAGTSENYRGLYDSAERARRIDEKLLAALQAEFPATAKLPPMAGAMVEVEHASDHLKLFAARKWKPIPEQPALEPDHEALLLREHFTELLRTKAVLEKPARFQELMQEGEASAAELETSLRDWLAAGRPDQIPAAIPASLDRTLRNCTACHKQFRDVPLSAKK